MTASSQTAASDPLRATHSAGAEVARLWQGGWAVGVFATLAALLAVFGTLSPAAGVALAAATLPGAVGYLWRPVSETRWGLLALWAAGTALAAAAAGGATGPLAPWCVAPVLVGALLGWSGQGVAAGAAAIVLAALLHLIPGTPAEPVGPEGVVLSVMGLFMLFGGAAGAAVLLRRDVRERAETLKAERRWFEGALAELPSLGAVLDREGRPEAVFGAAPRGLDPERLGEGLAALADAGSRAGVEAALCEALDHGAGEAVFTPEGAPDVRLRLALRRRGDDGLTAVVHELPDPPVEAAAAPTPPAADPSVLHALEQRVREAERAREDAEGAAVAKSRFLANMSHELRTPLNAIMGFSDIMRARMFGELSPKYGEYADLIHDAGRHLLDLINDVLDMSKIEAERYTLSRETFDAREAVNAAMRLLRLQADEAGVQLRALLAPQPLIVDADKRALKQIVLNLVSNALKFTPRDGSVTVTASARGGMLELVVADTGVGIAPEDLERLGRPYEQAGDVQQRTQGTGLGLSLVKALAGLHGGSMDIESALGEGAAVSVRMPVLVTAETAPPAIEPDRRVMADLAPEAEPEAGAEPPEDAPGEELEPEPEPPRQTGTVIALPYSRPS